MKDLTYSEMMDLYKQFKNDPYGLMCAAYELGFSKGQKVVC